MKFQSFRAFFWGLSIFGLCFWGALLIGGGGRQFVEELNRFSDSLDVALEALGVSGLGRENFKEF